MKPQNAAVAIREMLGCYNIMLHKMPEAPRAKKIAYGENIRMAQARAQATPARLRRHNEYTSHARLRRESPQQLAA